MKNIFRVGFLVLLILVLMTTEAMANGVYQVDGWTVDGGGGESRSVGSQYALQGTIGQYDANQVAMQDGSYYLTGGFWVRGILNLLNFIFHLPLVMR